MQWQSLTGTRFFAAVLGVEYLILSKNVINARVANQISMGDGGNALLATRIRAHGNFSEYAPFGLLLLALVDAQSKTVRDNYITYSIGASLTVGRILHAVALSFSDSDPATLSTHKQLRVSGMVLTFASILASCGVLLMSVAKDVKLLK
jgi:uncharacterized membrane protein YecN with MAPEG domain